MADYGRELQFGVFPTPNAASVDAIMRIATLADESSLDLIGIQDHPYQRRFLDTWSLMPAILARTERVRVFPDVASLPLRPPAVMAKAAASLDVLSNGRFELGLGAGAFWDAIGAMGGPSRDPGAAAGALIEAIHIIRLMWSAERSVQFDGEHYRLAGVHPGPRPSHPIGIWLGVTGPKMLAAVGKLADGWVPSSSYVPPKDLSDKHARIDEAAHEAGRDPATIARIYNIFGTISTGGTHEFLRGSVDQWVAELTTLVVEHGMDTFIFGTDNDDPTQISRFAHEIAPEVKAAVARHRGAN